MPTAAITGYVVQQKNVSIWEQTGAAADSKTASLIAISQWQKNGKDSRVIDSNGKSIMRAMEI